jgi:hypothetical protein
MTTVVTHSPEDTESAGAGFAALLKPGDAAADRSSWSGKTAWSGACARWVRRVTSGVRHSFINEYPGNGDGCSYVPHFFTRGNG